MADFDFSTISGALSQNFRPLVVRTFNATSMLLRTLPVERGEGKNCAWDVEGQGAVGENFADGADVSSYGIDTPNAATINWGLYRSNWKLTNLARAAARSSRSPAGLLRPMGKNLLNASRKLASTINAAGYVGPGTGTTIGGFDVALDDANTYAGIARAGAAYFRAKVFDPGVGTDPTIAQIRKDIFDIKDLCGETPDLAFCDSARFLKLAALFDPLRRFEQNVTIQTAKGAIVLDGSVGKIMVEGCTVIADKDATAGRIYYVNSQYVHFEYLPAAEEEELPEELLQMGLDDGYGPMPLGMNVYGLARTGAARKMTAEVQVQLVVTKPNACGVRKNVNG